MPPENPPPDAIGIAGSGRLARALGRVLVEAGERVMCVGGRDPARTRLAARFIGAGTEPVWISELPLKATRFLIAVSDSAIQPVSETLAQHVRGTEIALHTCGAKGIEEMRTLQSRGVACGTLHPLETVCSPEQGTRALRGAAFGVSGDEAAIRWAERIVHRLAGRVLRIPAAARPLYHAAAVMASNYLVSLIDAAATLMAAASGADRTAALRALAPLIGTALDNVIDRGTVAALTGPIERGDAETVQSHLAALAAASPGIGALYRTAGLYTLDVALRKGLAPPAAERMRQVLEGTHAG